MMEAIVLLCSSGFSTVFTAGGGEILPKGAVIE